MENDPMDWPIRFPAEMSTGTISVRSYHRADAAELFEPLADERVWEHMSRAIPADAAALDEVIRSRLADGYGATFIVRQGGRVVGITSVLFDPDDPAGAEIGGTLLDPGVWGTGVNTEVKLLLLAVTGGPAYPRDGQSTWSPAAFTTVTRTEFTSPTG
jgi:RimJ/RimL family protein N-acetyltransferase